jgi:hypothetical protein
MMATILKPPTPIPKVFDRPSVFLAGSIEMGAAEDWQARVERALAPYPLLILNPRRDAWDTSWEQRSDFGPFREQVEWELQAQEQANLIAIYFAPQTHAPITLLELGLFAHSGKLVVCCPEGFWRKGNVDIVCARYGVPQVADLDRLSERIIRILAGQ